MALKDGTLIEGRYEIIRAVTSGGMGSLYEAKDINNGGTRCAIKKMLEHLVEVEESAVFRAKFEAETSFLCTLNHEGIPRLYNAFVRDSTYYIVMEFVQGPNLEQELEERVRLTGAAFPSDVLVEDACQVLDILAYLHGQQPPLIHRDVKPANLIREYPSGRIKLVDFGLARSLTGDKKTMTQIGTLGYSPLEQLQGRPDPTSDLYALGVTMHHLLTGIVPTPLSIPPIRELAPNLDEELARIIDKACSPKPEGRYPKATEMADALRQWQLERTPRTPPPPPQPATAPRRSATAPGHDPRRGFLTRLMKSGEGPAPAPPSPEPAAPAPVERAPVTRVEKARPTTFIREGDLPSGPEEAAVPEALGPAAPAPGPRALPWNKLGAAAAGLAMLAVAAWFALPHNPPARKVVTPTPVSTPEAAATPVAVAVPVTPAPADTPTPVEVRTPAAPPRRLPTPARPVTRTPAPPSRPRDPGESFHLGGPRYPSANPGHAPAPGHSRKPRPAALPAGEVKRQDLGLEVGLDQGWSLSKNTRAATSTVLFTAGTGEAFDPLQSLEITTEQVVYAAQRVQNSFRQKRVKWTPLEIESFDVAMERSGYGKQELDALITRSHGPGNTRYYIVHYEVRRGKWSQAKFREEALKALEQVKVD